MLKYELFIGDYFTNGYATNYVSAMSDSSSGDSIIGSILASIILTQEEKKIYNSIVNGSEYKFLSHYQYTYFLDTYSGIEGEKENIFEVSQGNLGQFYNHY